MTPLETQARITELEQKLATTIEWGAAVSVMHELKSLKGQLNRPAEPRLELTLTLEDAMIIANVIEDHGFRHFADLLDTAAGSVALSGAKQAQVLITIKESADEAR